MRLLVQNDSHVNPSSVRWHLEKMRLKHVTTGQELQFPCNKWITDDHLTTAEPFLLELAAVRPDVPPLQGSIMSYNTYMFQYFVHHCCIESMSVNLHKLSKADKYLIVIVML